MYGLKPVPFKLTHYRGPAIGQKHYLGYDYVYKVSGPISL
jgi:hypothetical protein